jgi:hypothetical protein
VTNGLRAAQLEPDRSYLTTAMTSTSIRKSGCDSRRTSTAVLVDNVSPQIAIRASICYPTVNKIGLFWKRFIEA